MNIYLISLFLKEEETTGRDLEIVNVVQAEDPTRAVNLAKQWIAEAQPHVNVARIWSWTAAEFRSAQVAHAFRDRCLHRAQ